MFTRSNLSVVVCTALILATTTASGAEVTDEHRTAARIYARIEAPLANRDQKAYCDAFHGSDDYRGYIGRACNAGVKMGVRKPEQCTVQAVAAEAALDHKKCLTMNSDAFDATISNQRAARAKYVKTMSEIGIDGNRVIADERAKLQ